MTNRACTFFGHRDCPESVKPILRTVLEKLIIVHHVNMFYIGNQGQFDGYARYILRELKVKYPCIDYVVVLAYMPTQHGITITPEETMLPEGIESIHPKYAISWRNQWMLQRADFVVTYITHHWGGAARFAKAAQKQQNTVINIVEDTFSTPNHQ